MSDQDAESVGDDAQTVEVDDDLRDAVYWTGREIREARKALWDGKTGKAFASIEAAQEQFEEVEGAMDNV